jgi:hypothetical protein
MNPVGLPILKEFVGFQFSVFREEVARFSGRFMLCVAEN